MLVLEHQLLTHSLYNSEVNPWHGAAILTAFTVR